MKIKILTILMCFVCLASYAQTTKKKKKNTANRGTDVRKTQTPIPLVSSQTDTAKKVAAPVTPSKPVIALHPYVTPPTDGYYKKSNILNAKVTPYPYLREVDVAFSKRIWRVIDTREKMNQYLASPKQRLIDVLMEHIKLGELTAYDATPNADTSLYGKTDKVDTTMDPDGDQFTRPLTWQDAFAKLSPDSTFVKSQNAEGDITRKKVGGTIEPDSIVKFEIKEDWIFDKQRSVFEPRIVGLAPMIHTIESKAPLKYSEYQPAFWIYFPAARPILATKEVVSKRSDATGLSFDDVFLKRLFISYIIKQSNNNDEDIAKNFKGKERLYEAERIKKELQDWELNLWQY